MSGAADLPRLVERPHGSRLVTRAEAAALLGYSVSSMATVMGRDPDRWPRPAALLRRGRVWVMLWDADELLVAAPPATAEVRAGGRATISDSDGLLTCAECGARFRSLGRHLQAAHGMTGAEYRERHRLPATGALEADGVRQAGRERKLAALAVDPTVLDHLRPWHTAEHLDGMRETAIETHRDTMSRPLVRAHRTPGQRHGVQAMAAARRERLDEQARGAGYESMEAAIRATEHLPATAAAGAIGVGASTVGRWRHLVQQSQPGRPLARVASATRAARKAGLRRAEILRTVKGQLSVHGDRPTRDDLAALLVAVGSDRAAAGRLGVSAATVTAWRRTLGLPPARALASGTTTAQRTPRVPRPTRDELVARLAAAGSDIALAREMRVAPTTIGNWRRTLDVPPVRRPAPRPEPKRVPPAHGTTSRYQSGCRCDQCRAANTATHREQRARRSARRVEIDGRMVATHLPPDRHGTASAYKLWMCRCPACTTAHSAYLAARSRRAAGTPPGGDAP